MTFKAAGSAQDDHTAQLSPSRALLQDRLDIGEEFMRLLKTDAAVPEALIDEPLR
jgi:hypothetical protein